MIVDELSEQMSQGGAGGTDKEILKTKRSDLRLHAYPSLVLTDHTFLLNGVKTMIQLKVTNKTLSDENASTDGGSCVAVG